jgi:hypothetical protein
VGDMAETIALLTENENISAADSDIALAEQNERFPEISVVAAVLANGTSSMCRVGGPWKGARVAPFGVLQHGCKRPSAAS